MTSGGDPKSLAQGMEVPFAGLFLMMGGLFAWMFGMARREADHDVEWARVGRLVSDAREDLLASGHLQPPPSHSRTVERIRLRAPAPARPSAAAAQTRPRSRPRVPAEQSRPRPRPRTAAARAAAGRA